MPKTDLIKNLTKSAQLKRFFSYNRFINTKGVS